MLDCKVSCFEAIRLEGKNLKEVVIYDLFKEKAESFAQEMAEKYGLKARAADSSEEAVRVGDIISVAASSVAPVNITNDWLKISVLSMESVFRHTE